MTDQANPHRILEATAARYAALKTLTVEGIETAESDGSRRETPFRAWYAAPADVRLEHQNQGGSILISTGDETLHYHAGPKLFAKIPRSPSEIAAGQFERRLPDRPHIFLFAAIAQHIAGTEYLSRDENTHVIRVTYDSPARFDFRIDATTHLLASMEFESSHHIIARNRTISTRRTVTFTSCEPDQPLPPGIFEFTLPPDATEMIGRIGQAVSAGAGGGGFGRVSSGQGRATSRSSHWYSDTLVERSQLTFDGVRISFERRLTLSPDRTELRIVERIEGPAGPIERDFTIPLRP
jgi:hypothetical protein